MSDGLTLRVKTTPAALHGNRELISQALANLVENAIKYGKPVAPFGIGCWGYNLCPSRPESMSYATGLGFTCWNGPPGLVARCTTNVAA